MNLLSAAELFSLSDQPAVSLETSSCLHSLNKYAGCEACYSLCPSDAIQPGKPPALNGQACVACMACLPACPVGAYSGEDRVKNLLSSVARAVEKYKVKKIDLLCHHHRMPASGPDGTELGMRLQGCLAQLGVGTYLSLLALGVEKITVRLDECAQCPWSALKEQVIGQVNQVKTLAKPWRRSHEITYLESAEDKDLRARPGWNAETPPLSRADLLQAGTIPSSEHQQLISPAEHLAGKPHLSLDRQRRLRALRYLQLEVDSIQENSDEAMVDYTRVIVNDQCVGCNLCSQACPTQALERSVIENKEFRLIFHPEKCVNCQICSALCTEAAITLENPMSLKYYLGGAHVLQSGALINCQKCNTLFSPKSGGDICPTCQYRRANPFGSRMPASRRHGS